MSNKKVFWQMPFPSRLLESHMGGVLLRISLAVSVALKGSWGEDGGREAEDD